MVSASRPFSSFSPFFFFFCLCAHVALLQGERVRRLFLQGSQDPSSRRPWLRLTSPLDLSSPQGAGFSEPGRGLAAARGRKGDWRRPWGARGRRLCRCPRPELLLSTHTASEPQSGDRVLPLPRRFCSQSQPPWTAARSSCQGPCFSLCLQRPPGSPPPLTPGRGPPPGPTAPEPDPHGAAAAH